MCEQGSGCCIFDFYFFVGFGRPLYLVPNRLVFCLFLVCSHEDCFWFFCFGCVGGEG